MIGRRVVLKRGSRDEAERPFWISFADLMTALMVLFLVSLSVALVRAQDETAKAKQAQEELAKANAELEQRKKELEQRETLRDTRLEQREVAISACHLQLEKLIAEFNGATADGVRLDRARNVIDFGSRATFERSSHELKYEQALALREFTLGFLSVMGRSSDVCKMWLKRVVVEGFTDKTGSYLLNLNLSLNRSQRVMCVLLSGEYASPNRATNTTSQFAAPQPGARRDTIQPLEPISPADEMLIKQLFLVGGYSSNSLKSTDDESRRIELRIEFYQVDDVRVPPGPADNATGRCAIGGR